MQWLSPYSSRFVLKTVSFYNRIKWPVFPFIAAATGNAISRRKKQFLFRFIIGFDYNKQFDGTGMLIQLFHCNFLLDLKRKLTSGFYIYIYVYIHVIFCEFI